MKNAPPIIRRQTLELGVPSAVDVSALQARARHLCEARLTPVLDRLLDERSTDEGLTLIERLEVDLGHVELTTLEEELPRRLEEHLEPALDAELEHLRRHPRSTGRGRVLGPRDLQLRWLREYLASGGVPWSRSDAGSLGLDPGAVIEALLAEAPERLVTRLRSAPSDLCARRLAAQLPRESWPRLVAVLAPGCADDLLGATDHWHSLLEPGPGNLRPRADRPVEDFPRKAAGELPAELSTTDSVPVASTLFRLLLESPKRPPRIEQLCTAMLDSLGASEAEVWRTLLDRARRLLPAGNAVRLWLQRTLSTPEVSGASPVDAEAHEVPSPRLRDHGPQARAPEADVGNLEPEARPSSERARSSLGRTDRASRAHTTPAAAANAASASAEITPAVGREPSVDRSPTAELHGPDEPPPRDPWPVSWQDSESERIEPLAVCDAGLVLIAPFLPRFLRSVGLLEGTEFPSEEARERAVRLLHHIATGRLDLPEPRLVLDKVLCGWPLGKPLGRDFEPGKVESTETRRLLEAVIGHWGALGQTSVAGLRSTFLERPGRLGRLGPETAGGFRLEVERTAFDFLLERLPWALGPVALPCMNEPIFVEW